KNFRRSLEAIESILTHVAGKRFHDVPQMEKVKRQVYEDALRLCTALLRDNRGDAKTQSELALAYTRVAEARVYLGELEDSKEPLREAETILTQLVKDHPNEAVFRRGLAVTLTDQGHLLRRTGKPAEAEAVLNRALAHVRQLHDADPTQAVYRGMQ